MKLAASQIARFLNQPPDSVRAFLFYGPDAGLARERAAALIRQIIPDQNDPFAVMSFSGAALGSDEARLYDEAAAMVLGGGRRLIHLHQASEANAKPLARFLEDPPKTDSVIVIEAGDLDKRSKLRALCEGKTEIAAGIPCYLEDAATRIRALAAMLEKENTRASRDVLAFLESCLPPDRLALKNEMEKLALYAKGQKEISLEDVRAVIANAGGADMDELVHAVAQGDTKKADGLLTLLFEEQTSPVALLRAMQRHFMRLQLARAFMDQGLPAQEALKKLSPPVFWKAVDPMARQLRRWTAERLSARLDELLEAEAAVKRTGTPDSSLCARLLLGMAVKA